MGNEFQFLSSRFPVHQFVAGAIDRLINHAPHGAMARRTSPAVHFGIGWASLTHNGCRSANVAVADSSSPSPNCARWSIARNQTDGCPIGGQ